ncbi:neuronal acetylcholine receptor subunit beta-2-like [Saccoglossus kowalevskii]|uniref:Neuronal acetylcholine receptor subunit beta-2-like isoform X2 n=1 Tax=Saccoglossus kowalevskii TaxID=10224 RepID=A0ABM0MCV3_SACKO|nr:PREDICTED: neuronal acetylcholine receptor subunit beta-2-like isoform X2 [Saccoglossus kowalevskii]
MSGGLCKRAVMFSATILVFLSIITVAEETGTSTDHRRLLDTLFDPAKYSPIIRPIYNRAHVTHVNMTVVLSTIIDMDERNQLLKSNMWVTLQWIDEFMRWNPDDYGGIDNIKVPSTDIWLPDVVLYDNAATSYINFLIKQIAIIYYTGEILWAAPVIYVSSCSVDVTYFPFDMQNCSMKFGPWQHDGTEVYMHGVANKEEYQSDGQWDLVEVTAVENVEYYPDHPEVPYTDVRFGLVFTRRPQYYVFNLLLPNALFTVVTITVFYLPPESGEKISLSITILLSLTVFQLMLADFMPPSSFLPFVGYYFIGVMVLVSMSLVSSVLVLNVHCGTPEDDGMPAWVRRLCLDHLAPLMHVWKRPIARPFQANISMHRLEELKRAPTYVKAKLSNGEVFLPLLRKYSIVPDQNSRHRIMGSSPERPRKVRGNACDESELVIELLEETKKLTKYFDLKRREELAKKDWKIVAMVVDKLFLLIYIIGSVVAAVIFACQMGTNTSKTI